MLSVKSLPTISIVTCCFNTDLKIFRLTLEALKKQNYPRKKIQHIVMDGGSTNGSIELAKSYGCKVFSIPKLQNKSLVRMSLGITKSNGELILFLEPDNIMIGKNWIRKMVFPFDDKEIIGAFSIYNYAKKNMQLLTRYSALIGANDPTLIYLGKSEKLLRYQKSYNIGSIVSNNDDYIKVKFDKENLPTLGDNGHMVRRKELQDINTDAYKFL